MRIQEKIQPERALDYVEKESPLGLTFDARKRICGELDNHQASLFTLFHQYQKHHWLVEGPQFRDLHEFFERNYQEVHKDLDALAERLTALGGIPTSSPTAQSLKSYVTHESEGFYKVRQMLEADLKAETRIITSLRDSIATAGQHQDYTSETLMKQILMRAEDRAHHLDHYLADDSLEKS